MHQYKTNAAGSTKIEANRIQAAPDFKKKQQSIWTIIHIVEKRRHNIDEVRNGIKLRT